MRHGKGENPLSSESISGVKCKCGGKLKSSFTEVEFFGINFGIKHADVCTRCGAEYLPQEVMKEIETEVKKGGFLVLREEGASLNREILLLSTFRRK
jgi:hypothetical protein